LETDEFEELIRHKLRSSLLIGFIYIFLLLLFIDKFFDVKFKILNSIIMIIIFVHLTIILLYLTITYLKKIKKSEVKSSKLDKLIAGFIFILLYIGIFIAGFFLVIYIF